MKSFIKAAIKEQGWSALSLLLPALAFAQAPPGPPPTSGSIPGASVTSISGVLGLICNFFGWAFFFLIALVVIFVIVAAFRYLTAAGDPEKVKKAGSTLLYAAVAVGVALLARAIPLIVSSFLGGNLNQTC
jgi:uncharacterized membrane protein